MSSLPVKVFIPTLILLSLTGFGGQERLDEATAVENAEKLALVWTSGDPEVGHRMVLMYAQAAKQSKWFDEVRLVVWGPSARLLAADKDLQAKLKSMQQEGVILQACVVCADSYGVTDKLKELGLEVIGMGKPLSEFIKDDQTHVLTF